jgi:hypothetical protein
MKRFAAATLAAIVLWALIPAVGEFFENALHLAVEGHSAHAAPDGDHHEPIGSEHGCTGAVHLCSCCASLSFLTVHSAATAPTRGTGDLVANVLPHLPAFSVGNIYHPPRT